MEKNSRIINSNMEYHGDRTHISSSGLKACLKDERSYWKQRNGGYEPPTSAMELGTAVHTAILEPHLYEDEIAIYQGKARWGKAWETFKELEAGKCIITESQQKQVDEIVAAFKATSLASWIEGGDPEVSYTKTLDGVDVKVRLDYDHPDYVLDVKTTSKGLSEESLQRAVHDYMYDLSASLYLDIACLHGRAKKKEFYWLFLSTTKPYDVALVKASDIMIRNGRVKYQAAIEKFKKLNEKGFFDQPLPEIITLDPVKYSNWLNEEEV